MNFYKIEQPSTSQIFNAILDGEYTPLEKIKPKAKQLKVLLGDYFCTNDVLVSFTNVTNCGGCPIFFSNDMSIEEILAKADEDFYELSDEDRSHKIELFLSYITTYDNIFDLN